MFNYRCIFAVALAAVLPGPVGLAHADQDNMVQIVNSSSSAEEEDSEGFWTAKKVAMVCKSKFAPQSNAYKNCIERNERKIGREMNPADLQALHIAEPEQPATPKEATPKEAAIKETPPKEVTRKAPPRKRHLNAK